MYIRYRKLSEREQIRLIEFFVSGTRARTAASLIGIHRNSAIRFFHKLREKIALKQKERCERFCGKIKLDESYFGDAHKGKRGGKVYAQIIDEAKTG
jgi:transposase